MSGILEFSKILAGCIGSGVWGKILPKLGIDFDRSPNGAHFGIRISILLWIIPARNIKGAWGEQIATRDLNRSLNHRAIEIGQNAIDVNANMFLHYVPL